MAVTEESDERTDEEIDEDQTPKGVKKIGKTKVFAVTTVFSVLAYVWMYVCLIDQIVTPAEAWITLALFPVLILMALAADKLSTDKSDNVDVDHLPILNTAEFISILTNEKKDEDLEPGEL